MVVSNTNCSKNETLLWHIVYSKTTDANVNLGSGLSSDTDIEMWGNYTANWDAQIVLKYRGGYRGRTRRTPPLKLENKFWRKIVIFHTKYPKNFRTPLRNWKKIWFFGVKSWFFIRNTPTIFAPPSARRNFLKWAPLTWNPGSAHEIVGKTCAMCTMWKKNTKRIPTLFPCIYKMNFQRVRYPINRFNPAILLFLSQKIILGIVMYNLCLF
jgi:hypothetical protein